MKKKALALLLVLAMMLSIVLVSAPNVQAAPESPHTEGTEHCICGKPQGQCQSSKGGSHTYEAVEWLPWDDPNDLPTSGNYYLTTNVTISEASGSENGGIVTVAADTELNICLNGYTIIRVGRIFTVKGTLSVCDCGKEGRLLTNAEGAFEAGLARVEGTMNIFGGKLTRGDDVNGKTGGLLLVASATSVVNLYDGSIVNGQATNRLDSTGGRGGNIYMTNGTVNMYGGTISGGVAHRGGNVYVDKGTFNLAGGVLQGGTAEVITQSSNSGKGGNIYVASNGAFVMTGGSFVGGTISTNGANDLTIKAGYVKLGQNLTLSDRNVINMTGDLVINLNGNALSGETLNTNGNNLYIVDNGAAGAEASEKGVDATINGTVCWGERVPEIGANAEVAGGRFVLDEEGHVRRVYIGFDELTLNKTTKGEQVGYGMRYNAGFQVAEDLNVTGYGVEIKLGEHGQVKSQSKTGALPADGVVTIALTNILVDGKDNTAAYTTDIWARTYVQLNNGEAIYSVWYKVSFQEVVEAVSGESLADANAAMSAIEDLLS